MNRQNDYKKAVSAVVTFFLLMPPAFSGEAITLVNNQPVAVVSATGTTQASTSPVVSAADPSAAGPLSAATIPPLPTGFVRAASNVNFAFQTTATNTGTTKLNLMNLTTGIVQTLVEVNTAAGLSISNVRDVSADGKTVVYGYTGSSSTDYLTVVQDLTSPVKKRTLNGNLQTIEFLSVSGNYGNSPYPGMLIRTTYAVGGVTQTSSVDTYTINVLESLDKKASYEVVTNGYAYFVIAGSAVTVDQSASRGHDSFIESSIVNGNIYLHFSYYSSYTTTAFFHAYNTTTKQWREDVTQEEFVQTMLPSQLPTGWTRATSNVNFAFQTAATNTGTTKLNLMNLTTGSVQTLVEVNSAAGLSISSIRDVSADGKTVVYGYTGNNPTDYLTVVQDLTSPAKKRTLTGNFQTIAFLPVSGNWGNSPYPGMLARITYVAAGVTQTSIVDTFTINTLTSINKETGYELQTNGYAYFLMVGSDVTVVPSVSLTHPDLFVESAMVNGSIFLQFNYPNAAFYSAMFSFPVYDTVAKQWRMTALEEFVAALSPEKRAVFQFYGGFLPVGAKITGVRATSSPDYLHVDVVFSSVTSIPTGLVPALIPVGTKRQSVGIARVGADWRVVDVVSYNAADQVLQQVLYSYAPISNYPDHYYYSATSSSRITYYPNGAYKTQIFETYGGNVVKFVSKSETRGFDESGKVILEDNIEYNSTGVVIKRLKKEYWNNGQVRSQTEFPYYGSTAYQTIELTTEFDVNGVIQKRIVQKRNSAGVLIESIIQNTYPNGLARENWDYIYVNGVLTTLYYTQSNSAGTVTRTLTQTYYANGKTGEVWDYSYVNGVANKLNYASYNSSGVITRILVQTFYGDGKTTGEIWDYRYVNGVASTLNYAAYNSNATIARIIVQTYYTNGKIGESWDYRYANGSTIASVLYYGQYDANGTVLRALTQTYFGNGVVYQSWDYRYTNGVVSALYYALYDVYGRLRTYLWQTYYYGWLTGSGVYYW